ncbi:MAG: response regulator [Algicola sp.]|nr:response regulator [Algicola sp.]
MDKKAKILIVDDTPSNLVSLQRVLRELEVDIITADCGNAALANTLKHDIALILLDVQMPLMSGYEVAQFLQDNPNTNHIPIIFLTAAYKDQKHHVRGYESGAVDYIEKPINDEILIPKIRFFLKLYHAQQQLEQALAGEKSANTQLQNEIELREKLEQERLQALQQAQLASKHRAQFLATMSHEIRTPLNGVLGMAQLIGQMQLTDELRDKIDIIINSGSLLMTLINDILDFSKLDSGQIEFENIPFDLAHTINDVMSLLAVNITGKDIDLSMEYPSDEPTHFSGDPSRISQILVNLLGNAIKFTESGFIRIKAKCHPLNTNQTQVRLTVQDSGIGIDKAHIDKLFNSFTQADSSTTRKFGGTGLGLSICKQLVELMGGKIWLESELGKGSCFFVEFVLTPVATTVDDNATNQTECQKMPQTAHFDAKILLVEDNEINQLVAANMLENFGLVVDIAVDGQQAIECFRQNSYDLIFMDCLMPVMDGFEATKAIRAMQTNHRTPIVALTANALAQDREKCFKVGMDDFVTKPFTATQLEKVLNQWLKTNQLNPSYKATQ